MTAPRPIDWPQQAGILCNDPLFREYCARKTFWWIPGRQPTPSPEFAAEYLRRFCHIQSRRELATNLDARARFQTLRTELDAWAGRIASPR